MESNNVCLSIIGGGVMAEAILSRLLTQKTFAPDRLVVSEPRAERRKELSDRYGIGVTDNNQDAVTRSDIILLAIKPQIFDLVAKSIDPQEDCTIISILAGTTIAKLESVFPARPIVRVMPNTPATVGQGMTAIAAGTKATKQHLEKARAIFEAVGEVVEVPEYSMDAVTGLSGSGPAFVALAIEALADGGVASGLPRAIALQLATQTVLGTATLVKEMGTHPGVLKDRVTSPGGTTIAGVAKLESLGFRSALIEAVKTATERSQELGK